MPFFEKGDVRLYYEEAGEGPPLFVIYGGGLNSRVHGEAPVRIDRPEGPFDVFAEFSASHRCISMDLRNARGGQSTGPLRVDDPWGAHTDDQLALLDHLDVDRFLVIGFCIGNPMIWNLLQKAPGRVVAAISAQPSGIRPGGGEAVKEQLLKVWAPDLVARRPEVTLKMAEACLTNMYSGKEFIATTTRDFVSKCRTPLLAASDDIWAHPYEVCMEMVRLAPNAEVTLFPWKDKPENLKLALRHMHTFLKANAPG